MFQRSACIDCANVSLILASAATRFLSLVPLNMPGDRLQEALEKDGVAALLQVWATNPREETWSGARRKKKLPPSTWGGMADNDANAYLNDHFAFICIHLKIKSYENKNSEQWPWRENS